MGGVGGEGGRFAGVGEGEEGLERVGLGWAAACWARRLLIALQAGLNQQHPSELQASLPSHPALTSGQRRGW